MNGLQSYPEWELKAWVPLSVQIDVLTYKWPDYDAEMMRTDDAGRRRIIIEGFTSEVTPYLAAIQKVHDEAKQQA